jgi:hypothetical protein
VDHGYDVVYEGLLVSGESARPIVLHEGGYNIRVLALNTPIDVCIDSINQRRQAKKGPDAPPVKERNTIAKARAVQIAMDKMTEAGITCVWASREEALSMLKGWLEL